MKKADFRPDSGIWERLPRVVAEPDGWLGLGLVSWLDFSRARMHPGKRKLLRPVFLKLCSKQHRARKRDIE